GSLSRRMLGDGRDAAATAAEIAKTSDALASGHAQLAGGDGPVAAILKGGSEAVAKISDASKGLQGAAPAVNDLQVGAAVLPGDGKNLYSTAIALEEGLTGIAGGTGFVRNLIVPVLAFSALALLLYVILNIVNARRRIRRAEEKESRQQAAILGLLDEISNLADGDLTVRANVTGEFTGAIADSINYTVETLRSLVGTINETAVEMSAAATSTTQTADAMKAASEEQAQDVIDITHQVTHSSDSLGNMAGRAQELAKSATDSVEVAHNGASTVGRTILGMAALREQIQDTAKRIKRLGESSQEIGNIIEFINDIAEQTNTLALNASIQAAMAGESGRGFAVVADEVQRLAERAAAATRQIETLVKTIQADTNEAIVSMERSTTNVIAGARSAEEAGQALTRIESSSNDLARMIQEISSEARKEAAAAANIAIQMQSVRDIALSTSNSAQDTATAVGELNTLSEKLRESVAGFKLPTDVTLESGTMPAFTEAERREAA
ncbi:MAG TPA: methyl-accepting chemotaxis protein, partial [Nevskiaceae bacterium]|nr:methyl-accepting chemotaxis protein [Nevskiaceae bacterium]